MSPSSPSPSQEQANAVRWSPARTGFYEVHYIQWWDRANGVAGWVRTMFLTSTDRRRQAAVWGGVVGLDDPSLTHTVKQTYPITAAEITDRPFAVRIGASEMRSGASTGRIGEDEREIAWSLSFDAPGIEIAHVPAPMRRLPIPPTKFVSPFCGGRLSGWIEVAGRRYATTAAPAVQSHFWGPKNVAGWTWGHCSSFLEDPTFVFDGVSARTELFGLRVKPLNIFFFRMAGETYRCNGLIGSLLRNGSTSTIDGWRFEAWSGDILFRGEVVARPEEMTLWLHDDPDGAQRNAHLTFTADYRIEVLRRTGAGLEPIRTVTAPRGGIYEITLPMPDTRLAHRHPTTSLDA